MKAKGRRRCSKAGNGEFARAKRASKKQERLDLIRELHFRRLDPSAREAYLAAMANSEDGE